MSEASKPTASVCPNCGTVRSGAFCHRCGQNDKDYLRAVHRVASEMLGEAFELDSRLLRTFWALVAKPGQLTREFAQGRRARYMSPVRLYLITSLVFFFFLSISGDWDVTIDGAHSQEELAQVWEELRSEPEFQAVYGGMDPAEKARIQARFQLPDEVMKELDARTEAAEQAADADEESWGIQLTRRAMTLEPTEIRDKILDSMPIAMFFLLPVFALLMKLFYPRRYYTEHLVLGFHVQSFLFLLFTVLMVVPEPAEGATGALDAAWPWLRGLLLMGGLVYGFLTMKVVYRQSVAITALKFFLLFNTYAVLLAVAIAVAFVLTLMF